MSNQELIKAFLDLQPKFLEIEKMFLELENEKIMTDIDTPAGEVQQSTEDETVDREEHTEEKRNNSLQNKSKFPDYDYEDPTVPPGWGSKLVRNGDNRNSLRKVFRSPCGKMFLTRKTALEFMMKGGFSEDDVEKMRSNMQSVSTSTSKVGSQDWHQYTTNDPTVPKGWSSKLLSNGSSKAPKKIYRSPQGHVFPSRKKALEFMLDNSEKYSKYEIEKMKQHIHPGIMDKENTNIREKKDQGKKEDLGEDKREDLRVDTTKDGREEKGEDLEERKKVDEGGDKREDFEERKKEDKGEEKREDLGERKKEDNKNDCQADSHGDNKSWQSDPRLPPGWRYSSVVRLDQSNTLANKTVLKFKTDEGSEIDSTWKALKLMRSTSKYSNNEIESFVSFYREKNKSEKKEDVEPLEDKGNSEPSTDTEDRVVKPLGDPSTENSGNISPKKKIRGSGRFTDHPLLPNGWLLAMYELTKGGTLMRFKSPEGELIHSRKKVIEILKEQGYSRSEIENVAKIRTVKDENNIKNDLTFDKNNLVPEENPQNMEAKDLDSVGGEIDTTTDLEFSLSSDSELDHSASSILDEKTIMALTEDDFEIVDEPYIEESSSMANNTEEAEHAEEGAVSPPARRETEESLMSDDDPHESVGPKISFSVSNFDILSEAFQENNEISMEEASSLSQLTCLAQQDVKWFFLKVRHLLHTRQMEGQQAQVADTLESLKQSRLENDLITI